MTLGARKPNCSRRHFRTTITMSIRRYCEMKPQPRSSSSKMQSRTAPSTGTSPTRPVSAATSTESETPSQPFALPGDPPEAFPKLAHGEGFLSKLNLSDNDRSRLKALGEGPEQENESPNPPLRSAASA